MGTENLNNQNNRNYIIFRVMRWLIFGILLVVIPPMFTVWFKVIIGYKVNIIEYIPDLMLAVLSVSCNVISSCVDSSKRIDYLLRWILSILLGLISLACWGLFFCYSFYTTRRYTTKV